MIDFDALQKTVGLKPDVGTVGGIVTSLVTYIFVFAGFALLLYLIFGGFQLMTAGGDPAKVKAAREFITNAVVGFFIIFVAYWVVQAVGIVFGIGEITTIFK